MFNIPDKILVKTFYRVEIRRSSQTSEKRENKNKEKTFTFVKSNRRISSVATPKYPNLAPLEPTPGPM